MKTKIKSISDVKDRCILTENGCWEAPGTNRKNYPNWYFNGTKYGAHRLVKILTGHVFRSGEYALHKCDNRRCTNPDHIFIGTHLENIADMYKKGRSRNANKDKTHCLRGHEFNNQNTRFYIGGNGRPARYCKVCHKIKRLEYSKDL